MSLSLDPTIENPPKPGPFLLAGTTSLVLLNMWLGFAREMRSTGNISGAIGSAVAQMVIPILVALLFSLSARLRNARFRTKAVLWTSVLILLTGIAAPKNDPEAQLAADVKKMNTGPRMVDAVTRFDRVGQGPGMHITVYETIVTKNASEISKEVWQSAVPKLKQQMLAGPTAKVINAGVSVTYRYFGKDGVLIGDVASN